MRYIRPFDAQFAAGEAAPWLVAPAEEFGCALRVRRGGAQPQINAVPVERFALILSGEATLATPTMQSSAPTGSLIFIPAGKAGGVSGAADAQWVEIEAPSAPGLTEPRVIRVDPTRFEGGGFAYQSLADRSNGAQSMRLNVLQVQPGSGSPDFHIHAFAQLYVILEGEMTLDIGRARQVAKRNSIVCLPAGVVHRNFNGSNHLERHVSLLVPEPAEGAVFDYAVDIHGREATLLTEPPGPL